MKKKTIETEREMRFDQLLSCDQSVIFLRRIVCVIAAVYESNIYVWFTFVSVDPDIESNGSAHIIKRYCAICWLSLTSCSGFHYILLFNSNLWACMVTFFSPYRFWLAWISYIYQLTSWLWMFCTRLARVLLLFWFLRPNILTNVMKMFRYRMNPSIYCHGWKCLDDWTILSIRLSSVSNLFT